MLLWSVSHRRGCSPSYHWQRGPFSTHATLLRWQSLAPTMALDRRLRRRRCRNTTSLGGVRACSMAELIHVTALAVLLFSNEMVSLDSCMRMISSQWATSWLLRDVECSGESRCYSVYHTTSWFIRATEPAVVWRLTGSDRDREACTNEGIQLMRIMVNRARLNWSAVVSSILLSPWVCVYFMRRITLSPRRLLSLDRSCSMEPCCDPDVQRIESTWSVWSGWRNVGPCTFVVCSVLWSCRELTAFSSTIEWLLARFSRAKLRNMDCPMCQKIS